VMVSRAEVAEETLLAGALPCPARCVWVCCAHSATAGTRTVRGIGADTVTVTPRWARGADCQVTQILLPTALTVRCADSTEAIGTALVAHARSAGHRSIAAGFGRPESTVRDTARRPRTARAVAVPAGRRPRRRDRRGRGAAGPGRHRSGPRSGTR